MTHTDVPGQEFPLPMVKEETTKDDGRTLIYYSFPDAPTATATEEDTHV